MNLNNIEEEYVLEQTLKSLHDTLVQYECEDGMRNLALTAAASMIRCFNYEAIGVDMFGDEALVWIGGVSEDNKHNWELHVSILKDGSHLVNVTGHL